MAGNHTILVPRAVAGKETALSFTQGASKSAAKEKFNGKSSQSTAVLLLFMAEDIDLATG